MRGFRYATLAIGLGIAALSLADCSGAQSKAEVQLAAIHAGCKTSLDLTRDAGEAGAADEVQAGCRAALHAWESSP